MIKIFLTGLLLLISLVVLSQQRDSLPEPIIPIKKTKLLKKINITLDMRMGVRAYTFRGGDHYYNGVQFQNGHTALGISAQVHEKVAFKFRNRFNKGSDVQTLVQCF